MSDTKQTYFACADRASQEQIADINQQLSHDPVAIGILNAVDSLVVVVNDNRQIVAANKIFLDISNCREDELIGQRLGEGLNCQNAEQGPNGCGTSANCKYCGAVLSILNAFDKSETSTDECSLLVKNDKGMAALEFKVRATPLELAGTTLTVVVLTDISDQKRKDALEKVFLHDIANVVCGLKGWAELLQECESQEAVERIVALSNQLVDDVNSQRLLLQAESNEVELKMIDVTANNILNLLSSVFKSHEVCEGKKLDVCLLDTDVSFKTDMSLFMRVMVNMVKNALEASEPGQCVSLAIAQSLEGLLWCVHNQNHMPEEVAAHIFQRSYSTKSRKGRGLGTYSMKLFGENFLKGKVWFETDQSDGTNFYFELKI